MADMTREEVDAKIAASEARSDSKFASVIALLDALANEMRELRAELSSLKKTMILTGISSVLAIMFGMAGFNAALVSNMNSSFDAGKDAGQWRSETNQLLAKMNKLLDAMEAKQTLMQTQQNQIQAQQKQMSADLEQIKQERASGRK
jgi:hypothetical protein